MNAFGTAISGRHGRRRAQVGGIVARLVASGGLFPTPPFTPYLPDNPASGRALSLRISTINVA